MSDFPPSDAAHPVPDTADEGILAQAKQALARGDFDWIERSLADGRIELVSLTENLRIYQAELEVQNAELREAQAAAEQMAQRYRTLFSAVPLAQLVIDGTGLIIDANEHAGALFGLRNGHLSHHFLQRLLVKGERDRLVDVLAQARINSGDISASLRFIAADGRIFGGELHLAPLAVNPGESAQFICAVVDLSERLRHEESLRRSEERLDFLAHHDALTELPNRMLLADRLHQAIRRAKRQHSVMALLFIDLDRFKVVNDSLGHAIGDDLLRAAASRMLGQLRESDTLARVGGDEFVVLLEDADCGQRARSVASKLLDVLEQPFLINYQELFVTASIGISLYPGDGQDADALLRHADLAMYRAKSLGRNGVAFYRAEMTADVDAHLELGNALRGALARDEFLLHYQPQIDLHTGQLAGIEALVRWHHPSQGLIEPARFLPMAEELGIIVDIGSWVLEAACAQIARWHTLGLRVPHMAINLVSQQIERDGFVERVEEALARHAVSPECIEFEVTETMIMHQAERATATLERLRALGSGISVDDFGTGYSSLGYIHRLPIDQLKIDRSFIVDLDKQREDAILVRAIIGLGHSLGLSVVAEGIETEAQMQFLRGEGCRVGQGFLFDPPLAPEAFLARYAGDRDRSRR